MKLLRPISLLTGLLMTMATATAQTSLTPPAPQPPAAPPAAKQAPPKAKAPVAAKKPAATPTPAPSTAPRPTVTTRPAPAPSDPQMPTFDDPNVDNVYGAYQRGLYKTAFDLAITRAQDNRDAKAMTMLGELYANGLGIKRDYAKAADWYQRAADAGDRRAHV